MVFNVILTLNANLRDIKLADAIVESHIIMTTITVMLSRWRVA